MANIFTVGSITTTNPVLYVDVLTLGTSNVQYRIQSTLPTVPGEWLYVNQFCSLLSLAWLNNNTHPAQFGIANFNDDEKKAMAARLIADTSLDGQVGIAETDLHGTRKTASTLMQEVAKYTVGTKIWAGNDTHVFGIRIATATTLAVYDSNHGTVTEMPRANLLSFINSNNLTAFVVAQA